MHLKLFYTEIALHCRLYATLYLSFTVVTKQNNSIASWGGRGSEKLHIPYPGNNVAILLKQGTP